MGKKIFVSYKHGDSSVEYLEGYNEHNTARDYVDYLIELFKKDGEKYKGEANEDIGSFKDETIKNRLKDKIHDSSVTIVLISPKMKEKYTPETDQWIPWEISYSLKEINRGGKTSHTNSMLAVVLPDKNNDYSYFIEHKNCPVCNTKIRILKIDTLFQILRDNMFNITEPTFSNCSYHADNGTIYTGESSYILSVTWKDFIENKDEYLDRATEIRDNRKSYDINKEVSDE